MYSTSELNSPISPKVERARSFTSPPASRRDLSEPFLQAAEQGGSQGDGTAPAAGTTLRETVFNVLNIYVGLGLLSKPYAIARGGWLSLVALALLCAVANVTGKLIVRGFAKLSQNEEQSYAQLGERSFGPAGRWFVLIVVSLEFFGALMVVLIFVWKNALLLAPWYLPDAIISEFSVAVITTLWATPTVWALDFGSMAAIGFVGVVASVLIVLIVSAIAGWYAHLAAQRT